MPIRPTFGGLWRHPEFLKLWAGQTISLFGSQVGELALPLTAVLVLNASASEMGLLMAAERAPFLLLSLLAGVWVDRLRRRPVLIAADLGRAFLLASIPAAALLGLLRMEQLYLVGLLVGVCTVFFDVAYQSYLPSLVGREDLVEGNSKLSMTQSAAAMVGPGLAGALVQLVTAPLALAADALSFLVSALSLRWIHATEPAPAADGRPRNIWAEVAEGLRLVLGSRLLRPIALCTGTFNLFSSLWSAVFLLFMTRDLGLAPALVGLIFGIGGVGFLVGAVLAGRIAQRFGVGPTIVGSTLLSGAVSIPIALVGGPTPLVLVVLVLSQALMGLGLVVYNVTQVSLRQAITPDHLLGRMNASVRFIIWGTMPIGALVGGLLGDAIDLRPTLLLGAVGTTLAFLWVFFSPVRALREQPASVPTAMPVRV